MNALKIIRKQIEADPDSDSSKIFAMLVIALAEKKSFDLSKLYDLDYDAFQLAIALMNEWRLDRYYASTLKLMATAWDVVSSEEKAIPK